MKPVKDRDYSAPARQQFSWRRQLIALAVGLLLFWGFDRVFPTANFWVRVIVVLGLWMVGSWLYARFTNRKSGV